MADQGFFNFGNNAEENAAQIIAAYERIQRELGRPLGFNPTQLNGDFSAMETLLGRVQGVAEERVAKIKQLFNALGQQHITLPEFTEGFQTQVRQAVSGIPTLIAQELGKINPATLGRQNLAGIAESASQSVVQYLNDYARSLRPEVASQLPKGYQFRRDTFGADVAANGANPINFSALDAVAEARLRLQAEQLAKAQYNNQLYKGESPAAVAQRLGLTNQVNNVLGAQPAPIDGKRQPFVALGAAEDVREAQKALVAAIKADTEAELEAAKAASERARTANLNFLQKAGPLASETKSGFILGDQTYDKTGRLLEQGADEAKINTILAERDALRDLEFRQINRNGDAAAAAAAKEAEGQKGFVGAAVQRSERGGSFAASLGAQAASAFQFSAGYGLLFGGIGALKDTMHEFLDYQDSVTDLEVAMRSGSAVSQSYVADLSELSRVAGGNVGQALDAAARGVRALTDAQATQAEKEAAGKSTARAASQLALIANKSLPDATGDTLAIATGFGVQAQELDQVVDAVANAKRNVGGDAGQISQGLALISLSAQQAGYDLNQAAAVIGLVQARTDESGQAIATRLTRVFQIVQGSTGKNLAFQLKDQLAGITDSTGAKTSANSSVRDQIAAYGEIYSDPKTSKATRDQIASSLGGTANLRELLPLLKEQSTLQNAYTEALNNGGQGLDEYNRKSNNLVGTLKKIAGDVSNLQVNLAQSGVFDVVGVGIKALEPSLYTLNEILNVFNELPRPMRTVVGLLVDVGIAAKAVAVIQAARAAGKVAEGAGEGAAALAAGKTTALTGTAAVEAANAARLERQIAFTNAMTLANSEAATAEQRAAASARALTIALDGQTVASERAAEASVVESAASKGGTKAGFLGGLASVGRFAANPYTIVAATVLALGYTAGKALEARRAREDNATRYTDSNSSYGKIDGSAASYAKAAGELTAVAQRIDKNRVSVFGRPSADAPGDASQLSLYGRAQGLLDIGRQVGQEHERAVQANASLAFGTNGAITSVQQLADGMALLSTQGADAATTVNAVMKALATPPPDQAAYLPKELAGRVVAAFGAALTDDNVPKGVSVTKSRQVSNNGAGYGASYTTQNYQSTDASDVLSQVNLSGQDAFQRTFGLDSPEQKLMKAVIRAQKRLKLNNKSQLTEGDINAIVDSAAKQLEIGGNVNNSDDLRAKLASAVKKALNEATDLQNDSSTSTALNRRGPLTKAEITQILNGSTTSDGQQTPGLLDSQQSGLQGAQQLSAATGDPKFEILQAKKNLAGLKVLGRDGGTTKGLELAIKVAEHQYAQLAIARIDDLRKAAESRATSTDELRAVRLKFGIREAVKAGSDKASLEALFESLDKQTVNAIVAFVKDARDKARQAYLAQRALDAAAFAAFGVDGGYGLPRNPFGDSNKLKGKFKEAQAHYQAVIDAFNSSTISSDSANIDGESLNVAKANADAARLGGGIASARAAIVAAKDALHRATKGTPEWFEALAQLYQAQQQMSDAVLAYKTTLDQLHGDFTDPVEQARDALREAARKMAADAGKGKDVRAEDKLAVEQARAAAEAAQFQQRLSDVQTAEQLGQISYQAYIRYLEHESQRLHKIGGKTRQQIDEMNQIDLALKDAQDQATGFFNLGDIRTAGLVYQVRRFGAAFDGNSSVRNGPGQSIITQNSNNVLTINGADPREVKRLLKELLGPTTRTRGTSSRRV